MKKAIILAAGRGSRLQPATDFEHKALVPIGGQPLITRQIEVLRSFGLTSVSVVVGHAADRIQAELRDSVQYIYNPRYAETNSLYSLWMALNHWFGPFVLLNCDVLFHPSILGRLLRIDGSALAYDSYSGKDSEQMKVALKGTYVTALAKNLPGRQVWGENVGLIKFDQRTARLLYHETNRLIQDGHLNQWAPAAVSAVSQLLPIRAVDVGDLPWIEIDFPWDLKYARRSVCPSIPGCAYGTDPGLYSEARHDRTRLRVGHA